MLGYPILSIRSIPKDREYLDRYFKEELDKRAASRRRSSSITCGRRTTRPTARRRCGPRSFAAHHPNVVVLDLSSFKCGHDAPTYGLIDSIIDAVEDALRRAPRHRREQAGRLDQDPREDVRARAEAPRGAPPGRGASSKSELVARHRQEAPRAPRAEARAARARVQQTDPALDAADRGARAPSCRPTQAPPSTPPELPEGHRASSGRRREDGTVVRVPGIVNAARTTVSQDDHRYDHGTTRRPSHEPQRQEDAPDRRRRRHRRRARSVREPKSASASASTTKTSSGSKHGQRRSSPRPSAPRSRCSSRGLTVGARLPHRRRAQGPRLQRADARRARPTTALQRRQRVRQPRPVQPDVLHGRQPGEVPHHLRDKKGMTRRGRRQELRLPHRRRVRPLPLRHVRHRVPQGAPRRRLRRLPRHALPADGRLLAGDRRRRRPRDEPAVLHRRIIKAHRRRRRASTPSATASAPTRSSPARPTRADGGREEGLYDALVRARRTSSAALWTRKDAFDAVEGRQACCPSRRSASSASSGR